MRIIHPNQNPRTLSLDDLQSILSLVYENEEVIDGLEQESEARLL